MRTFVACMVAASLAASASAQETQPADPDAKRPYSTNGWELTWADEFDGNGSPDERFWSHEVGFVRNHEPQYYTTNRIENCRLQDGVLVLTARKEQWPNPDWVDRRLGGWKRQR